MDTYICWQSIKATESSPLNFLAIEAGKHASKSFVAVNVIDNMFVLIRLLREINSSINSTTATSISLTELPDAVVELIDELISRNNLIKKNILSITFTATKDLDACFPASIARKVNGLDSVAFLDCQQMYVSNDVDFCIRIMAQVLLPQNYAIKHPYLKGAAKLRIDRC